MATEDQPVTEPVAGTEATPEPDTTTDTAPGAEPAPAPEADPAPDSEPATEPAGDAAPEDDAEAEWNGALETIEAQSWFKSTPEDLRKSLLSGMKQVYRGWQASYTKKNQDLAAERKRLGDEHEARMAEVRRIREENMRLLYGEVDPTESYKKQIADLEAAHKAEMERVAAERDLKVAEAGTASEPALADLRAKLQTAEERAAAAEKRWTDHETAQAEQLAQALKAQVEKDLPHVYNDDAAWTQFGDLLETLGDYDKARLAVLALYPAPSAAPVPEPATPAEEAMEVATRGGPVVRPSTSGMNIHEVLEQKRRQAIAADRAAGL